MSYLRKERQGIQQEKQQGMVLVISLLLLLVLSLAASMSLESSLFAYKMSKNRIGYEEAFNHSESARKAGILALNSFLTGVGSSTVMPLPASISVDPQGGLFNQNSTSQNTATRYQSDTLQRDLHYQAGDISGDIYVLTGATIPNTKGAGSAQYQGYRGVGVGIGAMGSLVKLYEVRSAGYRSENRESPIKSSHGKLRVWTASDYRFVQ